MNKGSFNTEQMENPAPITDCGVHPVPHARPDFGLGKDPSSRLSELQMSLKQPYARYHELPDKIDGVNRLFSIEASLGQFCAVGMAYTKKEAKKKASTSLLHKMGYTVPEKDLLDATPTPVNVSPQILSQNTAPAVSSRDKASVHIGPDFGLGKDPNSRLSELQMLRKEKYAVYRTLQEKMVNNKCVFTIEASLNHFTATGSAFTKKEAKSRASTALLFKMGFTVPKEAQPMENGLQKQVTPPGEAAVMEEATERSREEHNLLEATGDAATNSESAESLVEIIEKTQLPEDPTEQDGLNKVSEITEAAEILPDQSVENINITGTSGVTKTGLGIQNPEEPPFPKDAISHGHQILQEMLDIALASPLWALTLEDETAEKPTEINTDEVLTPEETLGDSLTDAECSANAQSPLLGSDADSETSSTSKDLRSNCADKTSQNPLLWSEFRWLDGPFKTFQHLMEVPEGESVEEIPETSAGSSSESRQSPSDTLSPEKRGILDESTNSESAENLVASLIPHLEETKLPEDPARQEGLEEVAEVTEAGDILPDQSVGNIFVTSGIYNQCPKDTPSDGHQILEEMLSLALMSPLWAQTLDENEAQRTEGVHVGSEIPEASHTYVENISEDSYQIPEEHTCPREICSEDHQSLNQNQDPEPASPVETNAVDGPREEEHSAEKLLAVPESTENPETVPDRTAESFVIWIMMKKLFKNEPAHLRPYRDKLVDLLEKAALDHFVIPEGVHLKSKDVHKLGKAAARDLMYEYGGSFKVLLAAVGTKTAEFQEDAVKHMNIRLNAFKNRPKSGLKRLFSKWNKPYYY